MNYFQLLNKILTKGNIYTIRGLKTKELINEQLVIPSYENFYCTENVRKYKDVSKYLLGELAWYFSCDRNVDNIAKYSKFWLKLQKDGFVNSNYGYLTLNKQRYYFNSLWKTSFDWVTESLKKDKHTRQAVMYYIDNDYFKLDNKDFICTQYQHFFIRNNELFSIVYIRSSDAILGLNYDIPWWSIIQQLLFKKLKKSYQSITLGNLFVNIGSSHIYENKFDLVKKMLADKKQIYYIELLKNPNIYNNFSYFEKNINSYIKIINK